SAHLQVSDDGMMRSPELPPEGFEKAGRTETSTDADLCQKVQALAASLVVSRLVDRLPPPATSAAAIDSSLAVDFANESSLNQSQQMRGNEEFRRRSQYLQNNSVVAQNPIQSAPANLAASGLAGGVMTPLVLDGHLLLARRTSLGERECLQICWLDRPAIESWLTGLIGDLLPQARLELIPTNGEEQFPRRLAALPLVLVPGELPTFVVDVRSPLRWSLLVAWACVGVAAAAVAVLLAGVVSLSERRAAFVSAVTHELRTPLTTLRMYAEMLAEGMVPGEADRRAYLDTLRAEAERLGHLVENVLTYARLERGRGIAPRETVSVGGLLDRAQSRLAERCRQADMALATEVDDDVRRRLLHTDPASIEQIFFNLVDNACKYARDAADRRIHLSAALGADGVQFRVADHGRGLSEQARRRLFRPFSKSAEDAAGGAPGVGLGLSLCRRLARQSGGTFELDRSSDKGACFVLSVPIEAEANKLA
ncbi:MAG TPA: HAMP domain-containing sensor histidine kinase, partial [Pirellulales bacterium]|nr:HAMP domain-containing sensor histidine kinase [Pirellulales bacterium]